MFETESIMKNSLFQARKDFVYLNADTLRTYDV